MVNTRSRKKSDSPAAAKGKLSSLSTLMKKSVPSLSVMKLQKTQSMGSMVEPSTQPPPPSEQNVSVQTIQVESIVGIPIAPPSAPVVPVHTAGVSILPPVTLEEGSSTQISRSVEESIPMETDVLTSTPPKLAISKEGPDEKIPFVTSNVPTSSIDDAAKDAMDTSRLPEDDFSHWYTQETTLEKNDDTTQTASAIISDVLRSITDPEISTPPSAKMGDVPTSPNPLVPLVNIEQTLQKSADVPNITTQVDPSIASIPVSK
ncbi:hypothetical protein TorRG33x02_042210 [Trema orientale]|uniref:Uncharacterized protein n=1 Tax=Trema orientale TaxID=63057 RepID=A0A2P5FQS0_TREOI|nr:hypothetical protein TorRG33x02_042210 [Trema orientale]